MRPLLWSVLVTTLSVAVGGGAPLLAQQRPPADQPQTQRPSSVTPSGPRTGKERLGGKWTDEQRLDNCKVPLDKRGPKPRPDACTTMPLL